MQNNLESNSGAKPPFIPFETAWASLQPALEAEAQKRKREQKRLLFWWSLTACIILIGASWALYQHYSDASTIVATPNHSEKYAPVKNQATASNTRVAEESMLSAKKADKPLSDSVQHSYAKLEKAKKNTHSNPQLDSKLIIPTNKLQQVMARSKPVSNKQPLTPKYFQNNRQFSIAKKSSAYAIAGQAAASVANSYHKLSATTSSISALTIDSVSHQLNAANEAAAIDRWQATLPPIYNATSKASIDTLLAAIPTHNPSLVNKKLPYPYHFGLLWSVPLHQFSAPYRSNKPDRYLQMVLPQFWVGLDINTKHRISVRINPFAQLYLGQSILLSKSIYQTIIHQASQQKQENSYTETVYLQQLSGVEGSLVYQYLLAPRWRVGASISSMKTNHGWLHNTITKNGNQLAKDSVYKTEKSGTVGQRIAPLVFKTGLEMQYQIKKIALGLQVEMPLTAPISTNIPYTLTPNIRCSLNWQIK